MKYLLYLGMENEKTITVGLTNEQILSLPTHPVEIIPKPEKGSIKLPEEIVLNGVPIPIEWFL